MNRQEIYQKLIGKEYSLIITDLLKYLENFIKEFNSYSNIYNNLFSINKLFNSNYKNLEIKKDSMLIYLLINIIAELPESYFVFRTEQEEFEEWKQIENTESKEDFYKFLSKSHDFKYIEILQKKFDFSDDILKDLIEWKKYLKTNSIKGYSEYQKKYPEGIFYKYSEDKIEELKIVERQKPLKHTALHEKYWHHVIEENSVCSYSNYLKHFPTGLYKYNAELKLKNNSNRKKRKLRKAQKNKVFLRKKVIFSIISIAAILLLYVGSISYFYFKAENFNVKNDTVKATQYNKIASQISFGVISTKVYYTINDLYLVKWWNSLDTELKQRLFPDKYTFVVTLADIKNVITIDTANLSGVRISDFSFLKPLSNLRSLNLSSTNISDLSFLSDMESLEILNISLTKVKDLSPLRENKNLISLYCNYLSQIEDLTPLYELNKLHKLFIHNADLKDVNQLSEITSLTDINISNNSISDISLLQKLPKLKYISCDNNPIQSLEILQNLPDLRQIRICNILVSDIEKLDFESKYNETYKTKLNIVINDEIAQLE